MPELKNAFIRTLKLTPETIVDPDNSHLFAAVGAALKAGDDRAVLAGELIRKLSEGVKITYEMPRLAPLFSAKEEYEEFKIRHQKAVLPKVDLSTYTGNAFLGIDAGSTTTKMALIGEEGQLLFSFYANNKGDPISTAKEGIAQMHAKMHDGVRILRACSTGYGEALLKSAFSLDDGEVETIAHCTAASFFDSEVDCVLDIGGQDMKCIKLKNGVVDTILLNEACSSGCGSFIENFANSLGFTSEAFAKEALFASSPVDLGTRCTVFMNSNVKQAQKEGAMVSDISAGLAYSVIKNALYKVIKLADAKELGKHIVLQGGTFYNEAVLRAFEKIAGVEATCPDVAGLMGAFGAALIAKRNYRSEATTMLSLEEIEALTYKTTSRRCAGCSNSCMLTFNRFSNGQNHVTGNRCEKGIGDTNSRKKAPNMVEYKRTRLFDYEPLGEAEAPRGVIGIPRVLNVYENYPFWATFFKKLGFRVVISAWSSRKVYELGMESIPSESECYPAKLSHGHVEWLIAQGVKTIFHPCIFYERQETDNAQNHYNCPIVVSYAENIKNNVESITNGSIKYVHPFMAFTSEKSVVHKMVKVCAEEWDIPASEVKAAVKAAWAEQLAAKEDIRRKGEELLKEMKDASGKGIVLAGRPYHIDPEINHGIPELISSYGLYVFTEDALPMNPSPIRPLRVVDQWVYHTRLYNAAEFVCNHDDLELIQLNSFGCGLDAVTTDQVAEILEKSNKIYTLLKIDEVNNLGAVRIRIRSLLSAMKIRDEQGIKAVPNLAPYEKVMYTKQMQDDKYTIIAPQMSPIHFDILEPVFSHYGYNVVVLDNDHRGVIDVGLKYVNNDACFPSITAVGQIMDAVLSGKYDTNRLAIIMSQTGGCCRASNYVAFIRRALDKAGYSHIPVISLNANGMEKHEGLKISMKLLLAAVKGVVYGDLLMKCLYRVRPYELTVGSANQLHRQLEKVCVDSLINPNSKNTFKSVCEQIVREFDEFPIDEQLKKPKVGVVGEILVKYMPLANNHIVDLLEKEGAEAVVPDLMDFFNYSFSNGKFKRENYRASKMGEVVSAVAIKAIAWMRKPAVLALSKSKRFAPPVPIEEIEEMAKPILSIGNLYGEGWFLTGEMVELITHGTPNIVCIQPFACLPNHVVGKGVIKKLRELYPNSNVVAVDYDSGASEVNQLNRIKLMLSVAKDNM